MLTYTITCLVNGFKYVGSSNSPLRRLNEHKYKLRRGIHWIEQFQADWSAFGEASFVLCVVPGPSEQELIDRYRSVGALYNPRPSADSNIGFRHSDETKQALSRKLKGRDLLNSEQRARAADSLRGKRKSAQHVANAQAARKLRYANDLSWQRRNRWKDRKLTTEQVRDVRENPGHLTYAALGKKHGISAALVCLIRKRTRYAEIP